MNREHTINNSTHRVQTNLAKVAHYLHIAKIPELESQRGDSEHVKY